MKQEGFLEKLIAAAKDAGADVTVITPNKEKELKEELKKERTFMKFNVSMYLDDEAFGMKLQGSFDDESINLFDYVGVSKQEIINIFKPGADEVGHCMDKLSRLIKERAMFNGSEN